VNKTNLHTLDKLRNNICCEISIVTGKNARELTCSSGIPSAFGQDGNILSISCRTGEFLLDLQKVITITLPFTQNTAFFE
jgi:hypothetical protein